MRDRRRAAVYRDRGLLARQPVEHPLAQPVGASCQARRARERSMRSIAS